MADNDIQEALEALNKKPEPPVPAAPTEPAQQTTSNEPPTIDWKQFTDGKFESWEQIQEQLNKPPEVIKEVEPLKFANETSKQIYELLAEGKEEEVLPYLEKKQFVKQLDKYSDEDLIKLSIQREYPSFTTEDVQEEFERLYIPDELELNEKDFKREQKKAADRLKATATKVKNELRTIQDELVLPTQKVDTPPQEQLSDEAKSIVSFGESFINGDNQFPFEFISEDKTTTVKGEVKIPEDKFLDIKGKIEKSPEAFLAGVISKRWAQTNGQLNAEAIARDFALLSNTGEIVQQAVKQSHDQTLLEKLQRDKNWRPGDIQGGGDFMPDQQQQDRQALNDFFGIPNKR
jgi:DNA-binding Lrp family transcriptional regulator